MILMHVTFKPHFEKHGSILEFWGRGSRRSRRWGKQGGKKADYQRLDEKSTTQ